MGKDEKNRIYTSISCERSVMMGMQRIRRGDGEPSTHKKDEPSLIGFIFTFYTIYNSSSKPDFKERVTYFVKPHTIFS